MVDPISMLELTFEVIRLVGTDGYYCIDICFLTKMRSFLLLSGDLRALLRRLISV